MIDPRAAGRPGKNRVVDRENIYGDEVEGTDVAPGGADGCDPIGPQDGGS